MPGVSNIWTQPIINRINMLTTGIRSEVGMKIFGDDLKVLEERARAVAEVLRQHPGRGRRLPRAGDGAPYLDIRVNREAAARYGITVGAIQDVIETAVGETNLTLTIEGPPALPRARALRAAVPREPEALGSVLVTAPTGTQIPLGQLADIRPVERPGDDRQRERPPRRHRAPERAGARRRQLRRGGAQGRRRARSRCRQGSYIEWSGQYENQLRARQRLQIVIPVVLVVIFLLLYLTYRSFLEAAHVLLAVPFALSGGIYLLYALGYNFSVAVWVGFIALFGTAVQTAWSW